MSLVFKELSMPTDRTKCPAYWANVCSGSKERFTQCSDHPFPCEMLEEIEIEEMRGIELLGAGAKDKISARI